MIANPALPKLGLDLYSLRSQGWDAFRLLEFAAHEGAQVVNFSEPRFLGPLDDAHLEQVRLAADRLGLEVEVGMGSICPSSTWFNAHDGTADDQLLRMLDVAHKLGSPFVRCYQGSSEDREGPPGGPPLEPQSQVPMDVHIADTVRVCKAVRSAALDLGVKIAIENHAGGLTSLQLRSLIEEAGPEYVGALFDAGNATWTLEEPYIALETLAPFVLTSGIRDSAVWDVLSGAAVQWCALGDGNVGVEGLVHRFAELCPGRTFSLEIINNRSPRIFPYLEDSFWRGYRDVPAWVFGRFLKVARSGSPYTALPAAPPGVDEGSPEFEDFLVQQERRDVERAMTYARDVLQLGRPR